MKYILCFFIQILPSLIFCQNERYIKTLFGNNNSGERRINFIKLPKPEAGYWYNLYFKQATLDTSSNRTIEDLKGNIYFIDLNKDELPDIVDESNGGSAPVLIYLNCKDSFKLIVEEDGSLLKEVIYKENETEIIIRIMGMVVPMEGEAIYILNKGSISLIKRRFKRDCTGYPKNFYENHKLIRTITENAALREDTKIGAGECFMDTGEGDEYNNKNNILQRLPMHSKGVAWGEFKDVLGEKWLLAEFLRDEKDYQVGWIKADDIEFTKN
jgi:hypothetical protein